MLVQLRMGKASALKEYLAGERGMLIRDASNYAELDGQSGIQELAGDATLLYYLTDEAQEGKNAFLEKRKPNFKQYPKFP